MQHIARRELISYAYSRSVPSIFNIHPPSQDEGFQRTSQLLPYRITTVLTLVQSCAGISFKSQALYFFVYVTRYLGQQPP